MRRFLIVGCGGSGGATLAFIMDQLRSELHSAGIETLLARLAIRSDRRAKRAGDRP